MSVGSAKLKNFPEFQKLLRDHLAHTSRRLAVALNSRALNIVATASANTPRTERSQIEAELNVTGYAEKRYVKGPKAGQVNQRGKTARAIISSPIIFKIINARRGRAGEKGLYCSAMRQAVTHLLTKRFRGIGTLKAGWTGALRSLGRVLGLSFQNPDASSRVKGKSVATPAQEGFSPSVHIEYVTNSFDKDHRAYIDDRVQAALASGFEKETEELKKHLAKAINPEEQKKDPSDAGLKSALQEVRRVMAGE